LPYLIHTSEPGVHRPGEDCWCKPTWQDSVPQPTFRMQLSAGGEVAWPQSVPSCNCHPSKAENGQLMHSRGCPMLAEVARSVGTDPNWPETVVSERDRYRHALANIIARYGATPRRHKNDFEAGVLHEAEQMSLIAQEALRSPSRRP
jgi:hypothetical protein